MRPTRNDRLPNWARPKFACRRCQDHRMVPHGSESQPCPDCGVLSEPEYHDLWARRYREMHPSPEIAESNLSKAERIEFERLRDTHKAAPATVLSWLEGRRYRPEKDPEFLEECFEVMSHWRAAIAAKDAPWKTQGRSALLADLKNRTLAEMRKEDRPKPSPPPPPEDPAEAFNAEAAELFEEASW